MFIIVDFRSVLVKDELVAKPVAGIDDHHRLGKFDVKRGNCPMWLVVSSLLMKFRKCLRPEGVNELPLHSENLFYSQLSVTGY